MKYCARLTANAEQDVADALAWFSNQGAGNAGGNWFAKLMEAIETLERMPERCALAPEAADMGLEIRELLVGKRRGIYRVLFQIKEPAVLILRVWHSARDVVSRGDL